MPFMLHFKVVYLNACGWSGRPKHAAYIDEANKTLLWLKAARMSINMIYRKGMNSTKIA
jgi:hypothetical protein